MNYDQRHLKIAVDFDGTIVTNEFPDIGTELPDAIRTLKDLQKAGHKIIIWTCRCEPWLGPVTNYLADRGFTPDAINSNVGKVDAFGVPKIVADIYMDDRSFPPFTDWQDVRRKILNEWE